MTTFTTDDRQNVQTLLFENANKIVGLQEKIKFLETKNKWLMQQIEQLEIQIWGSKMNANEWAEMTKLTSEIMKLIEKNREQKEEIESLKKLLEHSVGSDCREMRYIQEIENKDAEIEALKAKLKQYHLKEDLDRNLNLIYGKEFIK